jgi:long-chain acyl-CoA synthetase
MKNNLIDVFVRHSSSTLLFDDLSDKVTYSDILKLSREIFEDDLKKKLVLTIIDNDINGLSGYVAILLSGNVPLMIDPKLDLVSVENLIGAYSPEFIWVRSSRLNDFDGWSVRFDYGEYLLLYKISNNFGRIFDELSLMLGTSGSTGNKKYVRLSSKNIWANASSISNYLNLKSEDIAITTLPPNYSYGLSIIHSHISVGASIAVSNKTFFDKNFWDFLKFSKTTSLSGVPYHYDMLKKLHFFEMDLPDLRTLLQAGGAMREDLTREFADHCHENGMRYFAMYGQTEASPRISYVPSSKASLKAGTIGIAIPGGSLELHSESGVVLSDSNITGELIYKGPNVCLGYAEGRDDLSLGDVNCGVLRTGDLAQRDGDGYYRIVGRQTRFIKLFGKRINLYDVESYLSESNGDLACSGRDDMLEIYLESDRATDALKIKQALMAKLLVGAQSIAIYEVGVLPRNESGKLQYLELHPDKARRLA